MFFLVQQGLAPYSCICGCIQCVEVHTVVVVEQHTHSSQRTKQVGDKKTLLTVLQSHSLSIQSPLGVEKKEKGRENYWQKQAPNTAPNLKVQYIC